MAGVGISSKLAIMQAATWGTIASLTTGHRIPFTGSTLQKAIAAIADDDLKGKSTRGIPTNGAETVPGTLSWLGDYRQYPQQVVAAAFMGSGASPGAALETGVYKHVLPWQPTTDGLFLSAGVDLMGSDVHGFASLKPIRRTIAIAGGGRWEESFEFLGAVIDKTIASSGWTYTNDPNGNGARRVLASQTVVRVNTHAGDALDSGDVVKPRRVTLSWARAMEQDFPVGQVYGEEPILGDFADVTIALEFQTMTAALLALFLDAKHAGTALKMDVVATHGTLLGATLYPSRSFYYPKLFVVDCPTDLGGAGPNPLRVTLSAHFSDAVPTGFPTGYDEECTEEIVSARSTALLA